MFCLHRFLHVVLGGVLLVAVAGCLPESFLSAPTGPSRSNNTWLLGVWETPKEGNEGVFRAVVTPVSSDRFLVLLEDRDANGKVLRGTNFEAWISKVGKATLITGQFPDPDQPGRFLVFGYQLLDPLTVRIREINPPVEALQASPFQLRQAIRRAFKEGTLYQGEEQIWTKTGEIFWNPEGNPATDTFTPPRFLAPVAPTADTP